ncbi:hypothetical protein DPEC_G00028780 [Dallia pectoralis]|uniref:Uncharacterized protein n=1 Tax=Dallia pectoralis TaxID=75939 RepID=A0ACC2HJ22_DALPE|nr:hypothetical protein DPEC_G00028780 [Dallia pectoralis]
MDVPCPAPRAGQQAHTKVTGPFGRGPFFLDGSVFPTLKCKARRTPSRSKLDQVYVAWPLTSSPAVGAWGLHSYYPHEAGKSDHNQEAPGGRATSDDSLG